MADAVVERLGEVGRCLVVAQRQPGAGANFDEIDLAGFLKGQPQLPGGQPQQARETLDGGPFSLAQLGLRQPDQHGQRVFQPGDAAQVAEQFKHGLLLVGECLVGREADALVDCLAQRAGAGQRQVRHRLPWPQVGDGCAPKEVPLGDGQRQIPVENGIQHPGYVGGGATGQRPQQRLKAGIEQVADDGQIALDQRREARLDLGLHRPALDARGVVQPLVAPSEHGDQQGFQAAGIVVHEGQRCGDDVGVRCFGLDHFQRAARRRRIMRCGILGDARLATEAAEVGHLPGQAGAQGIDRRDAQAAGVAEQVPVPGGIVGQHPARQIEGQQLVWLVGQLAAGRPLQAAEDAVAHLGRRLVGKGQRQHFLGMLDHRQQTQIALRQQFGLARPGRRLDDEGSDIQRPLAGQAVFFQAVGGRGRASACASRRRRSERRSSGSTSQYCSALSSVKITPACPCFTSLATACRRSRQWVTRAIQSGNSAGSKIFCLSSPMPWTPGTMSFSSATPAKAGLSSSTLAKTTAATLSLTNAA